MERRNRRRVETFMLKSQKGFVPVFMFGQHSGNTLPGLMLDISEGGCKMLLPKDSADMKATIRLKIQAMDQIFEKEMEILTRQCWSDDDYSIEHKAVGMQFIDYERQKDRIDKLIDFFQHQKVSEQFVRCELTPASN